MSRLKESVMTQAPVSADEVKSDEPTKLEDIGVDYVGEPTVVDMPFVYPSHLDPARQADPNGIYLDDIQRRDAEIQRAKVEERKPDFKNAGSTTGTPVVPLHVAQKTRLADATIEPSFTLPVELGIDPEQLNSNEAAKEAQIPDPDERAAWEQEQRDKVFQ